MTAQDRPTEENKLRSAMLRKLGAFVLVCGLALAYFCVLKPVRDASNQESVVLISLKGAIAVPAVLFAGIAYLLVPFWALRWLGVPGEAGARKWVFYGPLLVAGWFLYLAVKHAVVVRGYPL